MSAAVILRRGRRLEKVETSEHHPFHRCYDRPLTNHLGVDTGRNSDGVRREESRRASDPPSEPFHVIVLDRYPYPPELSDVSEGLSYLHANNVIHGNLNGVGVFFGLHRHHR